MHYGSDLSMAENHSRLLPFIAFKKGWFYGITEG